MAALDGLATPISILSTASDWLFSRILRDHADLKIALSEGGIGWIPASSATTRDIENVPVYKAPPMPASVRFLHPEDYERHARAEPVRDHVDGSDPQRHAKRRPREQHHEFAP